MNRILGGIEKGLEATHAYRAAVWILLIPVAIYFGWHTSVFVVFLYSTYANFIGDIDAWQAKRVEERKNEG